MRVCKREDTGDKQVPLNTLEFWKLTKSCLFYCSPRRWRQTTRNSKVLKAQNRLTWSLAWRGRGGAVGEGSGSLDIFLKTTAPYSCWRGLWRHSGGDALRASPLVLPKHPTPSGFWKGPHKLFDSLGWRVPTGAPQACHLHPQEDKTK
jgi:hypothetical protein